jgi:undecaprenyl-diphosphatase
MSLIHVIVLAIVQGLAELLPISSSAHVVVAEKLMGLDPSIPALTLLLVLLHTGTMFAVIAYFWPQWRRTYFLSRHAFARFAGHVVIATALTGAIGYGLGKLIVRAVFPGSGHADIEQLFSHLELIAPALFAVGILIIVSDVLERRRVRRAPEKLRRPGELSVKQSVLIGIAQAIALPFRGFSRSGATISTGMLAGVDKGTAESFSFALAVVLTPPVVGRELLRLYGHAATLPPGALHADLELSLLGGLLAFFAGLIALKWLSAWLERGRWVYFGIYCLVAAVVVAALHLSGF